MARARPLERLALAAACFVASQGCDLFDRELIAYGKTSDAGPAAECTPRHAPERPTVDHEADDVEPRWFLLRDMDLAPGPAWMSQGLDLDGACTTDVSDPAGCRVGTAAQVDGEDGIDNAFGAHVLPALSAIETDLAADARLEHSLGRGAIAVRLHEWNGLPDDPHVVVTIALSAFAVPSDDERRPRPRADQQPRWNGRDYVWLRRDSFLDGGGRMGKLEDIDAYVRDRVLVAALPHRAPLRFATSQRTFELPLERGYLVARLARDGESVFSATLVGQLDVHDLIDALPRIGVCEDDPGRSDLVRVLERSADLASFRAGGACDRIGVAIQMTGYPVQLGGITGSRPLPSPCGPPARTGNPGDVDE